MTVDFIQPSRNNVIPRRKGVDTLMASLADLANSILNTLNAIQWNTANTDTDVLQVKGDTGALNLKMNNLITATQAGFFNLSHASRRNFVRSGTRCASSTIR